MRYPSFKPWWNPWSFVSIKRNWVRPGTCNNNSRWRIALISIIHNAHYHVSYIGTSIKTGGMPKYMYEWTRRAYIKTIRSNTCVVVHTGFITCIMYLERTQQMYVIFVTILVVHACDSSSHTAWISPFHSRYIQQRSWAGDTVDCSDIVYGMLTLHTKVTFSKLLE